MQAINFPNTLTSIGNYAFSHCENLKAAVLNEGLTTVGTEVFLGCEELATLNIPQSILYAYGDSFDVNKWYYDNFPFYGDFIVGDSVLLSTYVEHGTEILYLPNGVKHLASSFIYLSDDVEEIIVPEGVLTFQHGAFDGFLREATFTIDIPDSVISIDGKLYDDWSITEDDIKVRCTEGSYAYEYAIQYGYQIILKV